MHIEDPNPTPPAAEPVDLDTEIAASMDAGIEAATEAAPAPVEPATPTAPAAPVEPPVPGTPEAAAAEAAAAAAAPPADPAAPPTEPAKDPDTEKEITDLGIKNDKTAARFRELTAEVKTLAPIKAALEAAGVKDVADLPRLVKRAENGQFLLEQVQAVASPEQFGQTMDYLGLVSRAGQGDRAAAEQAFELIQGEYLALAKALGREVPGVHDPLAEYPELQAEVESGMPRKHALELAAARTAAKNTEAARARAAQDTQQQTAQQQAVEQGKTSLNALEAELQADPQYPAKRDALIEKAKGICREFPPAQWATVARMAYAAIPAPAAAPAPTPVPTQQGALRPGGPRPPITPAVYDDPDAALEAGIAAASMR